MNYQVHLLVPHRTTQNSNTMFETIAQTLLELWQLGAMIIALGSLFQGPTTLLHCRQTLPRGALESGSGDWDQFKSRSG